MVVQPFPVRDYSQKNTGHFLLKWFTFPRLMAESDHVLGGSRNVLTVGGAMLNTGALIVDYGPHFRGEAIRSDTGIVCVVPSQEQARPAAKSVMRELVHRLGGNCDSCHGCPLGIQR